LQNFWLKKENQLRYVQWIISPAALDLHGDLRTRLALLTPTHFVEHGGKRLLELYGGSIFKLLSELYPAFSWYPWDFPRIPGEFWEETSNRKAYVDWLVGVAGVSSPADLKTQHFNDHKGSSLLARYHYSTLEILKSLNIQDKSEPVSSAENAIANFPDQHYTPRHYWDSIENQKRFMVDLATVLGFDESDYDRWYSVRVKDFAENGGTTLLIRYGNSIYTLLTSLYPEHEWLPWMFAAVPKNLSIDDAMMNKVLNYCQQRLNIRTLDDWHRVSATDLKALRVYQFFKVRGGLQSTLQKLFPNHFWNFPQVSTQSRKVAKRASVQDIM